MVLLVSQNSKTCDKNIRSVWCWLNHPWLVGYWFINPVILSILILHANWCYASISSCRLYHVFVPFVAIDRKQLYQLEVQWLKKKKKIERKKENPPHKFLEIALKTDNWMLKQKQTNLAVTPMHWSGSNRILLFIKKHIFKIAHFFFLSVLWPTIRHGKWQ